MEKDPSANQLSAKELTEAIDAATGFAAEESGDSGKSYSEIARDLGRVAQLTEERDVIVSNNEIKQMVAVENGYAEAGDLTPGENVVGGESAIEIKEHLAEDKEAAKIQSGEGLSKDQEWVHKIAAQSSKELVASVQAKVEETTKGDFNPNQLERDRFTAMLRMMSSDNGRTFGERN